MPYLKKKEILLLLERVGQNNVNRLRQRQVAEAQQLQQQQQPQAEDLLEYRREQQQEYAQQEYDQQIQQRLLNETIQFTRPENFSETRRNFVLPQLYIDIIQNEEIKDKINKYNNGEVNEIENDWSNTLLYFQPADMDKFIDTADRARKGYHFEKDIEDVNEAADESNDESVNEPVEVPDFNVLIEEAVNDQAATLIHAFYISNKETLTGLKFCPFCKQKAFDPKDIHFVAQYEKHIKKCEINGGKIVKEIKLEAVQRPFCPHIMQNKFYQYLLANNRENEFKPTQYYMTYDFETVEKVINKDFGKSSKQISQLVPLSVASTIKNKQDWEIKSYIGSSSQAKSIIAKHRYSQIKLKFCDIMVYVQPMTLKDFAQNFGEEAMKQMQEITKEYLKLLAQARSRGLLEKGVFPYEYINTDNFNDVLDNTEPFPQEAFNSTLKNSSMSDDEYKNYLDDAKEFKNSFMSMAACANAIKYVLAYKDFNINANYPPIKDK
ncbi:MAG: hypothetical protein EZS28_033462, partial [Streblomastix strix]